MSLRTSTAALAAAAAACLVVAGAALADPTGSKNNLTFPATCNGASVTLTVNNANGQGSGQEEQQTAEFAPAHVVGSTAVFHPTAFDLVFSFTPAGGPAESEHDTSAKNNAKTPVTCTVDFTQTDPAGNAFGIEGTAQGFFS